MAVVGCEDVGCVWLSHTDRSHTCPGQRRCLTHQASLLNVGQKTVALLRRPCVSAHIGERSLKAPPPPCPFGINQWNYRISTAAVSSQMICSAEKIWLKSVWYENEIDCIIIYAHICSTVSARLMRCFTFEKVLLFCPQVSEDIAFKYMLQLTNCVVFFHFVVGVRQRPLLLRGHEGSGWKRSPIKAKHGTDAACDCHDSSVMLRFFFFPPFLFWWGFFVVAQQGRIFPVDFWDTGKIISCFSLLVCSCIRKQSAWRRTAQLTEVPEVIQEGIFDSCCAELRYVHVKVPLEFLHKLWPQFFFFTNNCS